MNNLFSSDSQTIFYLTTYVNIIWSGPLQITVCVYMLWRYIGIAVNFILTFIRYKMICFFHSFEALAGLGMMVVFIPINYFVSRILKKYREKKMKQTDSRIKATNDMLNGIKVTIS